MISGSRPWGWLLAIMLGVALFLLLMSPYIGRGSERAGRGPWVNSIYPECDDYSWRNDQACWRLSEFYRSIPEWAQFDGTVRWSYWEVCRGRYCVPYIGGDKYVEEVLEHAAGGK